MIGDLNVHQIEQVLKSEVIGHLGCHTGERTYVVPVSYVYRDGNLYGHSGLGMKIEMMRENPQVCFQVEQIDDLANWRSVILWGMFEELDGEETEQVTQMLVERLTPLIPPESGSHPHPWNEHGGSSEHILHRASRHGLLYRIRISEMTGRYEQR